MLGSEELQATPPPESAGLRPSLSDKQFWGEKRGGEESRAKVIFVLALFIPIFYLLPA